MSPPSSSNPTSSESATAIALSASPSRPTRPPLPAHTSSSSSDIIDLSQFDHTSLSRQPSKPTHPAQPSSQQSHRPPSRPHPQPRRSSYPSRARPDHSNLQRTNESEPPQTDQDREAAFFSSANDIMRRIFTLVPPPPSSSSLAGANQSARNAALMGLGQGDGVVGWEGAKKTGGERQSGSVFGARPKDREVATEPSSPRREFTRVRNSTDGLPVAGGVQGTASTTTTTTASSFLPTMPKSLVPVALGNWWSGSTTPTPEAPQSSTIKTSKHPAATSSDNRYAPRKGYSSLDLDRTSSPLSYDPDLPSPSTKGSLLSNFPPSSSTASRSSPATPDLDPSALADALSSPLGLPTSQTSSDIFISSTTPPSTDNQVTHTAPTAQPFIPPSLAAPAQAHISPIKPNNPSRRPAANRSPSTVTPTSSLLHRPSPKSTLLSPASSSSVPNSHLFHPPTQQSSLMLRSPTLSSLDSLRSNLAQQQPSSSLSQSSTLPSLSLPSTASFPAFPPSVQSVAQRAFSTGGGSSVWRKEHKEMLDGMLDQDDKVKGGTMEEQEAKIRSKHKTPKGPIIFCHGLFGFDLLGPASLPPLQISHWRGIREILESNGATVFIARVPATSSIEERAEILAKTLEERFEGKEVNLVAHSMGGLDCRYLASQLKPEKFKVSSVTTIATPHRGSPFADYLIDQVLGRNHLPALLNLMDVLRLPNQGDGAAFDALTTKNMAAFNEKVTDDPNVKYYSYGAAFEPSYFNTFKWGHSVILAAEGPNDGLVSVESAKWGTYMGTLEGVNHLDLVGWTNVIRYTLSEWVGKPISFRPASFYLELADHLAKEGF